MNFERFERQYSNLVNLFREKGFYKKPNKFEGSVFVKFVNYGFEREIITSRLEEEIAYSELLIKSIFTDFKRSKEVNNSKMEEYVVTLAKIRLDLSDFYAYTRVFLDTLTMCIKLSFKSVGNKKWNAIKNSIKCLLNEKKLQTYKKEIDFDFFEGLEEKVSWIRDFKNYRDGLTHKYFYFVFTKTREGDLGYDIMDRKKISWGTETVKGILIELQNIVDNLSDLMEYLSKNLPRTLQPSGTTEQTSRLIKEKLKQNQKKSSLFPSFLTCINHKALK